MKSKITLLLLVVFNFTRAADSTTTLDDFIRRALKENLRIISSSLDTDIKAFDPKIKKTLPDPQLMLEARGIPINVSEFQQTREVMFMLEQMFPYPGKLSNMAQKAEYDAQIQGEILNAVQLDITNLVKQKYLNMAYADFAIKTNREYLDLLSQIKQVVKSKYIVGKAMQQDIIQVQIETAKLSSRILSLKEQRDNMAVDMNRILNRPTATPIKELVLPDQLLNFNPAFVDSLLQGNNPYLKIARLNIQSSQTELRMARLENKPDFMVMGGYMAMQGMEDAYMGRLSITLPFMPWADSDFKAQVQKAQVMEKKEKIMFTDILADLMAEKDKMFVSILALKNRIELYNRQVIPLSDQAISLSLKAYQTDSIDFVTLLGYAQELLDNKIDQAMLLKEYNLQIANIEKLIGFQL